jgi:hypothetical protein
MKDKDDKKNISGYSESQRKEYQSLYEVAAREAEKRFPMTFKPNTRGASETIAARNLATRQEYNKLAADLVNKKNYSDGDVGSVKSDVLSRNETLRSRARKRITSPVKGLKSRTLPKPGTQNLPMKPGAPKPGTQKLPMKPGAPKLGTKKLPMKPEAPKPGRQKLPMSTSAKKEAVSRKMEAFNRDYKKKK